MVGAIDVLDEVCSIEELEEGTAEDVDAGADVVVTEAAAIEDVSVELISEEDVMTADVVSEDKTSEIDRELEVETEVLESEVGSTELADARQSVTD